MNFCNNCGKQLADNETACAGCGGTVSGGAANNAGNAAANLMNTPDSTANFDSADIEANKVLSLFSYLGLLFLIPLLAAPNSKFARFHVNQGIILFIVNVIVGAVMAIPVLGWIIGPIIGLISFIFAILGIINAVTGKAKELPLIGKFKILN